MLDDADARRGIAELKISPRRTQRSVAAAKTFGALTTEDTEFTEARGKKGLGIVARGSSRYFFLRALRGAMVDHFREARKFSTIVARRTRRFLMLVATLAVQFAVFVFASAHRIGVVPVL